MSAFRKRSLSLVFPRGDGTVTRRLAIISTEEARAKAPPAPPSGIVAGRPTTERAEPKLALENDAERTLELEHSS